MPLITFTDRGLYCAAGNFYIDPWRPVERAVITHAHSDHARFGCRYYLCHRYTTPLLKLRLGENHYQSFDWNEPVSLNGVRITLFPAGHIIGSSQVRVEYGGETWVVSGDYKTEDDGISGAFEPVRCHSFITESTFGLPIYHWKPQATVYEEMRRWIHKSWAAGKTPVLIAYSLGKAQRILQAVRSVTDNIFVHGAIYNVQETLRSYGVPAAALLPPVQHVSAAIPKDVYKTGVVIAPPSAEGSTWIKRFYPYSIGICSGWMQVRGNRRRKNADAGFVLSDHCDWNGLLQTVEHTGAEQVFVTHGFQSAFSRYLSEAGIAAAEVKTEYGDVDEELGTPTDANQAEQPASDKEEMATKQEASPGPLVSSGPPPSSGLSTSSGPSPEFHSSRGSAVLYSPSRSPKSNTISQGGGMHRFAALVYELGSLTKTNEKLEALVQYFNTADEKDKVWVIALFSGRRPRRTISPAQLQQWCAELIGLPLWLFAECYQTVGDLSETIALLIPDTPSSALSAESSAKSLAWYAEQFLALEKQDESTKKKFILQSWRELGMEERFVFNKLLSGAFRIGVSQRLMVNALAKTTGHSSNVIAHRISGKWDPTTTRFENLLSEDATLYDLSKPYPFFLAYALDREPDALGAPPAWQAEWKWDGIRGQLIKRGGQLFVWSRGEDLITDKFPEFQLLAGRLPDGTVIDGEILPVKEGKVLNFNVLQTRIGRKNPTRKYLEAAPAAVFAYDLLEEAGEDIRHLPLEERRNRLEALVAHIQIPQLVLSPVIEFHAWEELIEMRLQARENNSEGLMLKRRSSAYQVGRKRGDWWKWKIDPLTIDAALVYAQKGAGRRSNLYTDYTFAVRDGDKLVVFTKAYSGLTDKELAQVDSFVKKNSIEKFGPVRTVQPKLVFEIAFEGIAASGRHKSGVALRFPRINRWRHDKPVEEINTLDDLKMMLQQYGK